MNIKATDLYKNLILEHNKTPKNYGLLTEFTIKEHILNELCGDKIELTLLIENHVIKNVGFIAEGCAISKAAASILFNMIKGSDVSNAAELANIFIKALIPNQDTAIYKTKLKDLMIFEPFKNYPSRIKCVLLGANLLLKSLNQKHRSHNKP